MRTHGGVSAYMTNLAVGATLAAHPQLKVTSPMLKWALHETAKGVFSTSVEAQFAAAFDAVHDAGADIFLRPMAGTDGPTGNPNTSQASWLVPRGVGRIRTLDNDPTPALYNQERYVPDLVNLSSAAQYHDDLVDWFTRIAALLNANDKGGHPRYTHCLGVCISGPENGTEMSLGYGALGDTVYTNCGTLTSSISGTGPIASFGVTSPSGATSEAIFRIGTELFHGTRSGSTVTVHKRAHSGSTAATHTAGAQVQIATNHITMARFNGYPASGQAPFDHRQVNRAAWRTLGSEAAARSAIGDYWLDASLAIAAIMPVPISVAGGQVFSDGFAAAYDVLNGGVGALGPGHIAFTTNLNENYSTTDEHAWLLAAKAYGNLMGAQTAGVTRIAEPPVPGSLNQLIHACEDALDAYGIILLETGMKRFNNTTTQATSAYKGWPGGTVTEKGYLLTA